MMADGIMKGELLRRPPSCSFLCSRSMVVNPPIPDAMKTPTRRLNSGVMTRQASSTANCEAAMAYWMKTSIFLTSFFSMKRSGSKLLTSPAICVENPVVSNLLIVPIPLWPPIKARQFASVPIPSDDTSPMPVTTTRLFTNGDLFFALAVRFDVFDGFLHPGNLFSVLIGNLDSELFLEGHDKFDRIQRVGAQIVDE